jgi:hypothetical protein
MSPFELIPSKILFRAVTAAGLSTPPEQLAFAASRSRRTVWDV